MSKNFDDLLSKVKECKRKKLAVAVAQDKPVLEAVNEAKRMGIADAILVGDNYDTDIMAGINCNIDSLLTLTGVTNKEQLKEKDKKPTYIVENLDEWKL